jgi:hypothetical protein
VRWAFVLTVLVAMLATACTTADPAPPFPDTVNINDFSGEVGDLVALNGFYFDKPARLCGIHLDSDPPRCGGPELLLERDPGAVFASIITVQGELLTGDSLAVMSWSYGP